MPQGFDGGNVFIAGQDVVNDATLLASAARTATASVSIQNDSYRGCHLLLNVTGVTAGTNEVQNIAIDATGGTFTLSFGGQTTSALAYNADPLAVETALRALSSIGGTNVLCSGAPGNINVTFQGALAASNVAQMTSNPASLTGGAQTATVTTTTPGAAGSSITLSVSGVDPVSGGTYPLLTGAAVVATGLSVYKIYPGLTASSGLVASDVLPENLTVTVTHANAQPTTYSLGIAYMT